MSEKDSKDPSNFGSLLEDEEPSGEKEPAPGDDTTQVRPEENYLQSLKEKIEGVDDVEPPAPGKPPGGPKHTFVAHPHDLDAEVTAPPERLPLPSELPSAGDTTPRKALFPFSEKTTQKLEEEIQKSSSKVSTPPSVPLRSERTSWHGKSVYVLCGPDAGKSFYITGGKIKVGRGLDNDVVLKDIAVSRKHCLIVHEKDTWIVRDLASDNGTYVDGKLVAESEVKPGQYIQIGRTILVVETS